MHTVTISDDIWNWAAEQATRDGPATYIRNIIVKEVLRQQAKHPSSDYYHDNGRVGGKGVHVACYERMVDERGAADIPSATALEAKLMTVCPKCRKVINMGDPIVMTNMEEWKT